MKRAVVTGTSRGLGLATAKLLLKKGFHVVGLARTSALELKQDPHYQHIDFDLERVEESLPAVEAALGDATELVFIHNASVVTPIGLIPQLNAEKVRAAMDTNLVGSVLLSGAVLRWCEEKRLPLRMIHISSSAAERPIPGMNLYGIAKAGIEMLVKSVHSEIPYMKNLTKDSISCVGFRPSRMDTGMQEEMRSHFVSEFPMVTRYQESYESGKLACPEQVAQILVDRLILGDVESGRIYSFEELGGSGR